MLSVGGKVVLAWESACGSGMVSVEPILCLHWVSCFHFSKDTESMDGLTITWSAPDTSSRMQTYSLGKNFLESSRHKEKWASVSDTSEADSATRKAPRER